MFKDYYSILGIPENVTPKQIKAAYRTQSLKWHPDKNPDRDTTEQMKDINEAYSILSNADTRARYDKEYQFYQYANPKNSSKQTSASEDNDYDIPWFGQLMTKPQLIAYLYQFDLWIEKYNIQIKI